MAEYIEREAALKILTEYDRAHIKLKGKPISGIVCIAVEIEDIPAADVLPRDEAIKMGAELAAMHGSDATSQQLEEAYLKGVEYGMTRRDVRPVVRGKWQPWEQDRPPLKWYGCDYCGFHALNKSNYCPNCGARMEQVAKDD